MDLSGFNFSENSDKGVEVVLRHPVTDEPLDIKVTVVGSDSKRYKAASHRVQNRSLSRGRGKITAERLEANGLEILSECVLDWENVEDSELFDEVPKCNKENVLKFLKKHTWAKEQIDSFIADRSNFLASA